MSDEESNLDYLYAQELKKEVLQQEFITELQDNCSDFVNDIRRYLSYRGSILYPLFASPTISVKVYNFLTNFLEKLK